MEIIASNTLVLIALQEMSERREGIFQKFADHFKVFSNLRTVAAAAPASLPKVTVKVMINGINAEILVQKVL